MSEIGRILVVIGLLIVICGILISIIGKFSLIGKLPGDILVKHDGFTFYLPITTSIIISIIISIIFKLFNR